MNSKTRCGVLLLAIACVSSTWAEEGDSPLVGNWKIVSVVEDGTPKKQIDYQIRFTETEVTLQPNVEQKDAPKFRYKMRDATDPKEIDVVFETPGIRSIMLGVFELSDDKLQVCLAPPETKRPTALESTEGSKQVLITLERVTTE